MFCCWAEQINGVDQVFTADFYWSLYWYDPRPDPTTGFDPSVNWCPNLDFINVGQNLPNYLVNSPYTYPADVTQFVTQPHAYDNDPTCDCCCRLTCVDLNKRNVCHLHCTGRARAGSSGTSA